MQEFDLIVIGTGPAGEKAAVKAAYFGYKVAVVEKNAMYGGAETITGTLPSKTLKETALYLSGKNEKGLYGIERGLTREASINDFLFRKNLVKNSFSHEINQNLIKHKVTIFHGSASFIDAHTILVSGNKEEKIEGKYILIATGSYPYHPNNIPFDNKRILDSDSVLEIEKFPKTLAIVGAGVIGCEYSTIFSTIGTKVYLINDKDKILSHIDKDITHELVARMTESGVEILFNKHLEKVDSPQKIEEPIKVTMQDGQVLQVDMFLFAAGRNGNIGSLKLENAGVKTGPRETVLVDKNYKTNVDNIYAAGDVIGFPALASTSMEQGRVAVAHMFQTKDLESVTPFLPYGIYTIPEVSTVGITEQEAIEKKIPYLVGIAKYSDMARGKIMGAQHGFLKLIFHKTSFEVLGVHIIGHIATELIHYGVNLVSEKETLWDVIGEVFNFPTLHDLYKYAAYNGLTRAFSHQFNNVQNP